MKRLLLMSIILIFSLNIISFAEERRPLAEGETRPRWEVMNDDYLPIKNEWYHRQYDGAWLYLDEEGLALQNTWFKDTDGKWYYFDEYCYMLHDTTTPDGYTVGPDGAWVQN